MKPIGTAADQLAFRLAIGQAEASLEGAEKPAEAPERPLEGQRAERASQSPQEASQRRQGRQDGVRSLQNARARQKAAAAAEFTKLARKLGMDLAAADDLIAAYLADTRNAWTFAMISPAQNDAVVDWLSTHSKRPQAAVRLWSHLFTCMRMDTGEILKGREELAERLDVLPRHVSSLMTELASINAVRREKQGREVRYFMNSTIATHLPSPEARAKAREADGPLLVVMQGGRTEPGSAPTS
jgi:pyruvate/2-oxoglutarate dehydrogenase complex dihydrolipoamide acyltransferase (E2) component